MNAETTQQQELSLYKALLHELLRRSCSAVVLLNREAEVIFCTPGIASISGYTSEELAGRSAFDFFHPADLPAARQQHDYLAAQTENASAFVLRIRHKSGQMVWIDVTVHNLLHSPAIQAIFVLMKKSSDRAVENRRLAQALAVARKEEREFLATELHDNINQVITATKHLVELARISLDQEELLKISSDNLQLVSEEIRKLTYSMVSYDLQEFGLSFAFHTFINMVSKASGITFHARLEEDVLQVLTKEQQLQVYRILQESSNNIIRHSEATEAKIALSRSEDLIYLTITDNGKGFQVNRLKPGVGLSSITRRVKILEGHFHIRSERGKGTLIEIHFPM